MKKIDPRLADLVLQAEESLRSRKPYLMLYRRAPQDGQEERWVEAMASVIEQNGEVVRLVGICRDVTDRQKLLRELRARAKQQETVARLGERALTESDLQGLFEEIVTTVADIRLTGSGLAMVARTPLGGGAKSCGARLRSRCWVREASWWATR